MDPRQALRTAGRLVRAAQAAACAAALLVAGQAAAPKRTVKTAPAKPAPRKKVVRKAIPKKAPVRPAKPKALAPRPDPLLHGEALLPFLEALRRTQEPGSAPVRVLHFGDSHTAADYWTGRIRERLQVRFGNGGPGLVMAGGSWRGYPHQGARIVNGRTWEATSLRSPLCDGAVGLAGATLVPAPGESFQVQADFADFRVLTLDGPSEEPFTYSFADPASLEAPPAMPLALRSERPLADGRHLRVWSAAEPLVLQRRELALALPSNARLLGVELFSGKPGVVYDELGLNGAELLDLERWSPELRDLLLNEARPDLLVLAYGTNESGNGGLDPQDYRARATALLTALKQASGAPILLVGPPDRSNRYKRRRAPLQVRQRAIIQALKEAAAAAGCAFWDARQAMGGEGAILRWRRSGLAQRDLVHLTGSGYQRLGDQLADALLKRYDSHIQPHP